MPKRNLAWILVIVLIALLMWQLPQTIAGRDTLFQAFGPLVDVRAQIHKRYVQRIDDEQLVDDAVKAGIQSMIAQLHDPYAVYLDAREYARFQRRTEGLFGGIGVDVWATGQGLEVLSREPRSPAHRAGIQPGDIITHIDGRPTLDVPLEEIVNNMLNGPPDSEVDVTVRTPGQLPRDLKLRRATIELDPVRGFSRAPGGGWRFMLDGEARIGYVRLTKFTPAAVPRLDAAVERLGREGMQALVLDLRQNTGGLLDAARDVADRFLSEGLIFSTKGLRSDTREWFATREGDYPNLPLVVLIDGSTASAAEIVAGALRDTRRATVIGERSYGKGCVQEVVRLDHGGGALKLTTAYYHLPGGECIQRTAESEKTQSWGVRPNIAVSLTDAQRRRWFEAWREIGREPTTTAPTSEPTTQSAEEVEESDRRAAASQLLTVDPPLVKAVEILRHIVAPERTDEVEPATNTTRPGDDLK